MRLEVKKPKAQVTFVLDEDEAIDLALVAVRASTLTVGPRKQFLMDIHSELMSGLDKVGVQMPSASERFKGTPLAGLGMTGPTVKTNPTPKVDAASAEDLEPIAGVAPKFV